MRVQKDKGALAIELKLTSSNKQQLSWKRFEDDFWRIVPIIFAAQI
ncbi:hypothetical protein [Desulfosporosinus sp. FKB]|nr:hypothetical protein [Desulfosporosinus sp. FKB]